MKQIYTPAELGNPDVWQTISSRLTGQAISVPTGFEQAEIDDLLDASASTTLYEVEAPTLAGAADRLAAIFTDCYDRILLCIRSHDMAIEPAQLAPLLKFISDVNPSCPVSWSMATDQGLQPGEVSIALLCGESE